VGATGSVGFALSHLLAADGYKLALVGRSEERVRTLLAHLKKYAVQFSGTLSVLQDADITVILTNDPTAAVTPEMFGRRGVIIDVAQPLNIAPTRHKLFKARDLYVCEGGLVKIPGYLCSFDFGLARGTTFACLAETYLFSRDGLTEHSIGRASPELARYLKQLASRYGIGTCALSLNSSAPSSAMPAIA
jgi:predicted amino acid dehydrogenase